MFFVHLTLENCASNLINIRALAHAIVVQDWSSSRLQLLALLNTPLYAQLLYLRIILALDGLNGQFVRNVHVENLW